MQSDAPGAVQEKTSGSLKPEASSDTKLTIDDTSERTNGPDVSHNMPSPPVVKRGRGRPRKKHRSPARREPVHQVNRNTRSDDTEASSSISALTEEQNESVECVVPVERRVSPYSKP